MGQREISREETISQATRRNKEQSTDLFRFYHILSEYIRPIGLFYYFFFSFKLRLLWFIFSTQLRLNRNQIGVGFKDPCYLFRHSILSKIILFCCIVINISFFANSSHILISLPVPLFSLRHLLLFRVQF